MSWVVHVEFGVSGNLHDLCSDYQSRSKKVSGPSTKESSDVGGERWHEHHWLLPGFPEDAPADQLAPWALLTVYSGLMLVLSPNTVPRAELLGITPKILTCWQICFLSASFPGLFNMNNNLGSRKQSHYRQRNRRQR